MTQQEVSENQTKKKSHAGIVVLVILLILAGFAGYLYYSIVKAPLALDDPEQMASSAGMASETRFAFSAADRTARVKLDAADLWTVILNSVGNDFLDTVNRELKAFGASVSGCAIRMEEKGLRLDIELFYKETRLIAKVPCTLEFEGKHLTLAPAGVKLGIVPLPVKGLLTNLKFEYDSDLPVLTEVTGVEFVDGAVVLSGPLEEDIRALIPQEKKLSQIAVFSEDMQETTNYLQTQEGFAALFTRLEQEPGYAEDIYRDLFVMADPATTANYRNSRYGLTERFFPGIDFASLEEAHTALTELVEPQALMLDTFFTSLSGTYSDKLFTLSEGEFLRKKKPFDFAQYDKDKYDALYEVLDPEEMFLILVDAKDGFIRNTSSFYRMAKQDLEFTRDVDYNKTYILGCVIRSISDEPYLMYDREVDNGNTYSRVIRLMPLAEEEVAALNQPGKFGVWTDK